MTRVTPSKDLTTVEYELFLEYARITELLNDVLLDDTFSKIAKGIDDMKSTKPLSYTQEEYSFEEDEKTFRYTYPK